MGKHFGKKTPFTRSYFIAWLTASLTFDANGCWIPRQKPNNEGYVVIKINNKSYSVHILSYKAFIRNKIEGQIDHECNNRACCNPFHLYDRTAEYNTRRARGWILGDDGIWTCKRGHRMEGHNAKRVGKHIRCRRCQLDKTREYKWKAGYHGH